MDKNKKNKGGTGIKWAQIKDHLAIFIDRLAENPKLDRQMRENMIVQPSAFSSVELSGKFFKLVQKPVGVVSIIVSLSARAG